jgi:hypothetical protein
VALLAPPRTGNVTGADYVIDGGLVKTAWSVKLVSWQARPTEAAGSR